jgi:hypothetical protein
LTSGANEILKQSMLAPEQFTFQGKQLHISWGKKREGQEGRGMPAGPRGGGLIGSPTPNSTALNTLFIGGIPTDVTPGTED